MKSAIRQDQLIGFDLVQILGNADSDALTEILQDVLKVSRNNWTLIEMTPVEKKICFGLLLGLSAKAIANARGCSYRTVETHKANIKRKLNVVTLTPLFLMAVFS
jgi:DNA-binding CsgD family transcriptional regulator